MLLTGQTILITGGSSGIGLALAEQLVSRENVVLACARDAAALDRARANIPSLKTYPCDLTVPEERSRLVQWATENHPNLNVLINNAGIQVAHNFGAGVAMSSIEAEVNTNLLAPLLLTAELLPHLQNKPHAAIVNVTSGLAFSPLAVFPVYCATKAAMHTFTLCLRHQLRGTAIRVIEIAPPIVLTNLGGMSRDRHAYDQPVLSAAEFARETLTQLAQDIPEILVGLAVGARAKGEALFAVMND